ncbi:MAG: carbohydrate ABC transporter permease [Thermomicrobiales bacterium]|nr:carbohydrate ABC transporter permease [Thermomicrobiales bacterium]
MSAQTSTPATPPTGANGADRPTTRPGNRPQRVLQLVLHLGLLLWAIHAIYPLIWIFLTSLKRTRELYENPFGLPSGWHWSNYTDAWVHAQMGTYFVNSVVVTALSTVMVLFFSSTSAYVLARFDFRFKGLLWAYVLFGFLIPYSILLIPLAIFTREIGIYNSVFGLALVYAAVGIPWNIFFLRAFMETIPKELEEAAVLDGAGMVGVFKDIILPLSTPALATMATFHILSAWSEYILALVLTGTTASRTLPVGISLLEGHFTSNEPGVAAGMMITIIPAVLAFLFLQRFVIRGLTAGALKG